MKFEDDTANEFQIGNANSERRQDAEEEDLMHKYVIFDNSVTPEDGPNLYYKA